jgi:Gas vesicle synthesis protein GvpL/GvpF
MAMGKYLYCIIRGGDERTFDGVAAIGDSALPVYTVPYGALAAVVSDSPFERYEATRANLVSHERVIEAVMREQTPLPVRFGTIADPADAVADIQKLLDTRATEFDGLLREMDGRVEMGLKAFWRSDAIVFDQIVAEDAQIRALRDSLKRSPSGASQASRIRLGEMVKAALGRRRDAEAAKILAPLRSIAERVVENPVLLDRMILNGAFLVRRDREAEFDRPVAELDRERGEQIRLMYVGPVAPYNFVRIVVNWAPAPVAR